jgi:hypothetical protein
MCEVSTFLVNNMVKERSALTSPPGAGEISLTPRRRAPKSGGGTETGDSSPPTGTNGGESLPPGSSAGEEAAANAELAWGGGTLEDLLNETVADLDAARRKLAALTVDDRAAELEKWMDMADTAARRSDEHLAKVNQRDRHLKWMGSILKKIGNIVGEDDYAKLPATVKVFVDASIAMAV